MVSVSSYCFKAIDLLKELQKEYLNITAHLCWGDSQARTGASTLLVVVRHWGNKWGVRKRCRQSSAGTSRRKTGPWRTKQTAWQNSRITLVLGVLTLHCRKRRRKGTTSPTLAYGLPPSHHLITPGQTHSMGKKHYPRRTCSSNHASISLEQK